jgi:murein DD-endopeptidase MepM/ murein hydrolase activator NlpD
VIGRCGNSGNSTEAHLHYHLQNTAAFGAGEGLPAPFNSYFAYARAVERGEPTRGQHIRR